MRLSSWTVAAAGAWLWAVPALAQTPATAPATAPAPASLPAAPAPHAATKPADADAASPRDIDLPGPINWANVCRIGVASGRLIVHTDLTPDDLDRLGPDLSDLQIDGIRGTCTVSLTRQRFLVRNTLAEGDRRTTVLVYVTSSQTSIESVLSGAKSGGVMLYQAGWGNRRRDLPPRWVRLTAYGDEVVEGHLTLTAPDWETLRLTQPHAVNRYVRPILRQLGRDIDLLGPQPAAARQVLQVPPARSTSRSTTLPSNNAATAPASTPDLTAEVKRAVAELDGERYARRDAAAARLAAMGPAAMTSLHQLDRAPLSAQQNLAIDRLLAPERARYAPLPPEQARHLRTDQHFLFDCLYCDEADLRAAAADLLSRVAGRPFPKDSPVLDPKSDWNGRAEAIEKLRDAWVKKASAE